MNIINVKINFETKKTEVTNIVPLTVGDYNSTKIIFEFDRDDGTKVFEMSNPKGKLVFLSEIISNELILGGKTDTDEPASIFSMPGKYVFEVSLYTTEGKLTSAMGILTVEDEGVKVEQNVVDSYFPLIHKIDYLKEIEEIAADMPQIDDCSYLFYHGARLNQVDKMLKFCKGVISTSNMFYNARNLQSLDLSSFDTSNVTNMNSMFMSCSELQSLDLSNFNTSKVTNMNSMFAYCRNLQSLDLSSFDTSNVVTTKEMFNQCYKLQSLDLSNFNTSKVTNMNSMFMSCSELQSLDLSNFNTSKVTDISQMFYGCENLQSLDLSSFDTSNVTNMSTMFYGCKNLQSLDLSSFDTSNVTNMSNMFYRCSKLTNLKVKLNRSVDLHYSPLSEESVNWILNNINTVTNQTLTLGETNKTKATPESLANAQSKGWTIN